MLTVQHLILVLLFGSGACPGIHTRDHHKRNVEKFHCYSKNTN